MIITSHFRFEFDDDQMDAVINGELDWQTLFKDDEPEVVK